MCLKAARRAAFIFYSKDMYKFLPPVASHKQFSFTQFQGENVNYFFLIK
ncbi:hypothetical protein Niako_4556 [Niastella koreensis GR20-10]|uniref:Uncharacterized protein n=1 Tax=Niastella koreensis (strain DSM 17620 / KACC 11465 / NBRC 106392 / GR20-10) TaxID=700598 RepID=G8TKX5_NIAKG|nr:hypothetical protein Niako_4556 [Niastella koreensis GR20-10]